MMDCKPFVCLDFKPFVCLNFKQFVCLDKVGWAYCKIVIRFDRKL